MLAKSSLGLIITHMIALIVANKSSELGMRNVMKRNLLAQNVFALHEYATS